MTGMSNQHGTEFIDFHTHILPQMDDGAANLQISAMMLNQLKQQNVNTVVLTPHFYTNRESQQEFLNRRAAAFRELIPAAEQLGIRIIPACELYLTDYIFHYGGIVPLCVNSGKYLLTELPYSSNFNRALFSRLIRLVTTFNVVPVIAHVERYPPLLKDKGLVRELHNIGCFAQINLGSVKHSIFQRRTLLHYIGEGLVQVVGTDCHNMTSRPPKYQEGIRVIEKELGAETLTVLMNNAAIIIKEAGKKGTSFFKKKTNSRTDG